MVTRGSRHDSGEHSMCVFPRPLPCLRIQSPVQREIRVRSRGDQAMVDMSRCPAFCGPTAEQSVPTPLLPLFIGLEGEGTFMQMTVLLSNPLNALNTSGTWVSFLCLRETGA